MAVRSYSATRGRACLNSLRTSAATILAPETLTKLARRITAAQELDKKNAAIAQERVSDN